ncbi:MULTISPECIES: hypothetical protein [Cryobacterium]|uniref:hypothetical protein n=1 Tax=Cryobacterium TaxID=69578 RepID=UPI001580057C|nr:MULTISPECIES: hypothetical protein [Cryobacterium]
MLTIFNRVNSLHRIGANGVGMPDFEKAWVAAHNTPGCAGTFLCEYSAFTLLVIDE